RGHAQDIRVQRGANRNSSTLGPLPGRTRRPPSSSREEQSGRRVQTGPCRVSRPQGRLLIGSLYRGQSPSLVRIRYGEWKSVCFPTSAAQVWAGLLAVKDRGHCCRSTPVTVPFSKPAAHLVSWSLPHSSRRNLCTSSSKAMVVIDSCITC